MDSIVTGKDGNGYNMFHRAAIDHNKKFIEEIRETTPSFFRNAKKWLNQQNIHGDTPLTLACMNWKP